MYSVRATRTEDFARVAEIYAGARDFMCATGNPDQWVGYPSEDLIREDIRDGISYVILDGEEIVGVFVFFVGNEPYYADLDGWRGKSPCSVIHRIASDGRHHGILRTAADFALCFSDSVRLDTGHKNRVMQASLRKNGFRFVGYVYFPDDFSEIAEWLAYEKCKGDNA